MERAFAASAGCDPFLRNRRSKRRGMEGKGQATEGSHGLAVVRTLTITRCMVSTCKETRGKAHVLKSRKMDTRNDGTYQGLSRRWEQAARPYAPLEKLNAIQPIQRLVRTWLEAGIVDGDEILSPEAGIPPGRGGFTFVV